MRTIETKVFKFCELSESAKENARDWYRQDLPVDYDFIYDDAAHIADLMGIDLCQTRKTLTDGSHYYAPTIYWSGFWSQGDGACFECAYRYKKGSVQAVKEYASQDVDLLRIAKGLKDVQRKHFYKLTASASHRGHYYHSGCMSVSVEHSVDRYRDIGDAEDGVTDLLRDFADWIYNQLEKEYKYQNSDESVDDALVANEYEFDEDGNII